MALPLRSGGRWYHDFPKLARESGFYFNIRRTPIRIDWNRMSAIDIDRVIRDRDFLTIDENVSNVVDYSLENTYDVKILDANFVKIFRFAQLSIEYLLYCRQYLDQSVILLKDDLKAKLEDNQKLKKELSSAEEYIKELKSRFKDRCKIVERKFSDSNGEIHKCPHCPKTFISSIFMASHMSRRHSNQSLLPSSPAHDEYRAEAEKLHSEIKSLKERLNETERVIRTESSKLNDSTDLDRELERTKAIESFKWKKNEEYDKYREDISEFKRILFTEIQSLKHTDEKKTESTPDNDLHAMKTWAELIKQQDNEIQRLRDQLQTQLKPDIASVQSKIDNHESLWQSKIQEIERQHRADMEKLKEQVILNQQATEKMRTDYISKIAELEETSKKPNESQHSSTKSQDRSSIQRHDGETSVIIEDVDSPSEVVDLNATTKRNAGLNSQKNMSVTASNVSKEVPKSVVKTNSFIEEIEESESSAKNERTVWKSFNKSRWTVKPKVETFESKNDKSCIKYPIDVKVFNRKGEQIELSGSEVERSVSSEDIDQTSESESKGSGSNIDEEEDEEEIEDEEEEEVEDEEEQDKDTEEESEESEEESFELRKQNNQRIIAKTPDEIRSEIRREFDQRLKDLGVDPEWKSIPLETYRQLTVTITHHRNLNKKKYRNLKEVRQEIVQRLSNAVSRWKTTSERVVKSKPKASLNKTVSNVTTKAFKSFKVLTTHMQDSIRSNAIAKDPPKRSLRVDLLPNKMNKNMFQMEKTLLDKEIKKIVNDRSTKALEGSPKVPRKPSRSFELVSDQSFNHSFQVSSPTGLITSTPQHFTRDSSGIVSPTRKGDPFIRSSSSIGNKGVLKTSTTSGSTSLRKKKVLFDLYTNENEHFSPQISGVKSIEVVKDLSDSNEEISSSVDENLFGMTKAEKFIEESADEAAEKIVENPVSSPKNDDFVAKPSASEKIMEIAKKIDKQLSLVKKKPIGGVQTMFIGDSMLSKDVMSEVFPEKSTELQSDRSEDRKTVKVLPKPAPRSSIPHNLSDLLEFKSNSRESNLDLEIEELLRLD